MGGPASPSGELSSTLSGDARHPSAETLSTLLEEAPFGVFLVDSEFRLAAANRVLRAIFPEGTPLVGRDFAEIVRSAWPEPRASEQIDRFRHTLATGEAYLAPRFKDARRDLQRTESYDWEIRRVPMADGTFGVVCYFNDLTTRLEAEEAARTVAMRDAFLTALDDNLRPLRDPADLQNTALLMLGEHLGVKRVHYAELNERLSLVTVWSSHLPSGRTDRATTHSPRDFGPLLVELSGGHPVVERDVRMSRFAAAPGLAHFGAQDARAFAAAPVVQGGELRVVVGVSTTEPRRWESFEIVLVQETAARLWAAVARARAEIAVANDLRDTRLLHDLSVRLVSESDSQAFFEAIVEAALAITSAAAGTIRLLDPETDELKLLVTRGFEEELVRRFTGPTLWVRRAFATGERIFIDLNDLPVPHPEESVRLHIEAGFRSAQATPLLTRAGRIIGVFTTYWRERRRPPACEMRFLDMLARQAVDLIERRRADDALRESQRQLSEELADAKLLQMLSAQLIEEGDSTALQEKLLDAATSIMRSDAATLQILHPERGDGGELHLLASRGLSGKAERQWEWVSRVAHTTCAHCLRVGTRVLVSDFERCDFMVGTDDQRKLLAAGVRAGITTPLVSRSGKTVGMITSYWSRPHHPSERELRLLDLVARQAADFLERTQALDALRQSERQLKEADRHKDEFLAVLAHELRNPLAPIRTGLELIRLAGDSPGVIEDSRSMMDRQLTHMVRLIDDLLDVSRIASGKIQLRREPAPLKPLVSTAVETVRALLDSAPLSLDLDLPDGSVLLDVDPTRFVQILSNVLHNAFKFSKPQGRVCLAASVREAVEVGHAADLELVVRDAGVGISAELMPRLFEMFSQEGPASSDTRDGLGIGLALTRRLVEMHGGTIRAESAGPGFGSTFTIRLPLAEGTAPVRPVPLHPPAGDQRRVVVIDDNVDAAVAMGRLVRVLGCDCRVAYDGESGLAEVLTFRPDVVLLDIGMRGMDGYEVSRRIRTEIGREIMVVAITGWGRERDKLEAKQAGFDAHLTKPADADALEALLWIGGSRSQSEVDALSIRS